LLTEMLHERHGQLDPPVGTGAGADAGASDGDRTGAWTGQKRRKTPSDLPPEPADQDPSIAREEEFQRCLAVLSTRRPPLTIAGPVMDAQRKREVFERISLYRIRSFKVSSSCLSYPSSILTYVPVIFCTPSVPY
jgi:hypothetical protein